MSSKGEIYLPLIDYVHIADLTAEEAEGVIQRRLADGGFVKNPHVTLFVDQYASEGASVLGEVGKPGIYPVPGQQRLFDLISAAGGFTEKAGRSIQVTHRDQPDQPITVPLSRNVTDNPESNIPILPGDTIIVRKADLVSHGQWASHGAAGHSFGRRYNAYGKSGRCQDHSQRTQRAQ